MTETSINLRAPEGILSGSYGFETLMVNDTGYVPPIHPDDRPRLPFSWKTVVLAIIALLVLASPVLIIWATKGF